MAAAPDHRERADRAPWPEERPGAAEEAAEHRSGAERRGEQAARAAGAEAQRGDEWLQDE